MTRQISRTAIIAAIVLKDLRDFSRDRLWMILTPFALAIFIVVFWILPKTVDETMTIGLYPADFAEALTSLGDQGASGEQGLRVVTFDDENRLIAAVSGELDKEESERISIGVAFPDDFVAAIQSGSRTTVSLYLAVAVPKELERTISSAIREIAYGLQAAAAGMSPEDALPVTMPDEQTIILGEDRAGIQVPIREKMRPLLAIIILMIEALALAGLVAVEIEHRTVTALLVTPARTGDFLAAKSLTGAILGLSQALLFLLATRSFGDHWFVVTILMILGAIMFSAVGLLAGTAGKDFMSTLFFSMVFIIPLMIPAFAVLFPGSASIWIKALPSYGFIEAMVGTIGYGRSWGEVAPYIGGTLAWDIVLFAVALLILKRRVETL